MMDVRLDLPANSYDTVQVSDIEKLITNKVDAMSIYKPLSRLAAVAADLAIKIGKKQVVVAKQTVNKGKIEVPALLHT